MKQDALKRTTISKLRKLFKESSDPEMAALAPYASEGYKVFMYMLDLFEASDTVKAPRGIKVKTIEIQVKDLNDEKAIGALTVADFLWGGVAKQFGFEVKMNG